MEKNKQVYPAACPICGVLTNYIYLCDDGKDKSEWYRCECGVVFQKDKPKNRLYDNEYIKKSMDIKNFDFTQIHSARVYANLIEELTYGRKILDVGFTVLNNMKYFSDRGWITKGIEVNKAYQDCNTNLIYGDFETYEFKEQFNLIWMSNVLQHFDNPLKALQKAYDLLFADGLIFIAAPAIEFINIVGCVHYPHWKSKENYILWSERALEKELERIGFKICVKHKNTSDRFSGWCDVHMIGQKTQF